MDKPRTTLKATAGGAFAALLVLSGCGSNTAGNQASANEVNAAAIAADPAEVSANQMHNQMDDQPREDRRMGDGTVNESHGTGMGNMPDRGRGMGNMPDRGRGMKQGNMPAMGGNTMSNQAMPMEREPHM